jgi:hypothetical protein
MKFFVVMFILAVICEILCDSDSSSTTSVERNDHTDESEGWFDKVYSDGTWRTKGILESERIYSNGESSWIGFWDEEHRSNGEVVYSNGDVYDKDGQLIAHEYEDICGITHRIDKR